MAEVIRAVYEHGRLRPLDPVSLADGQHVRLAIVSEREHVRMALADILVSPAAGSDEDFDEAASIAMIDAELRAMVSVSDAILEEREQPAY